METYDTQGDHGDFLILGDPFDRDRVYLARRYVSPNGSIQYTAKPLSKDQLGADTINRHTLSLRLARTDRELAEISRITRLAVEDNLVFTPDAVSFLIGLQCSLQDKRRNMVEHAQALDTRLGQETKDRSLVSR